MNTFVKYGAAALVLLGSALPAAAEDIYFTLYNESSRSLHYFYASPSVSTSWGPDLLRGGHTLRAGYNGTVTIADGSTECYYDFKFIMPTAARRWSRTSISATWAAIRFTTERAIEGYSRISSRVVSSPGWRLVPPVWETFS